VSWLTPDVNGGRGAGVGSVWEQYKPKVLKLRIKTAESPPSAARFVGTLLTLGIFICKKAIML